MNILGVDPGPDKTAFVLYDFNMEDYKRSRVTDWSNDCLNKDLFYHFSKLEIDQVGCESIVCYGKAVGRTTFETAYMVGRVQQWADERSIPNGIVSNPEIRLQLCRTTRAGASESRRAILDRFPRTGGGKTPEIGTKGQQGPLYGMAGNHMWSAFAVAVYYSDKIMGLTV